MMIQKQKLTVKGICEIESIMEKTSLSNHNNKMVFSTRKISEHHETCIPLSMPTVEQSQRVSKSKGKQEQNDQLQIKANELEKLFAEHQLRSSGGRSDPLSRRNSPDMHMEEETNLAYRKQDAEIAPDKLSNINTVAESVSSLENSSENSSRTLNYGNVLKNLSELSVSEESRGKFYSNYKQMRDAKLREEWDTKRTEKEAKMKAMHDNFARSKAEMTARFSGTDETKHSVSGGLRCREQLRSSNIRSTMMMDEAPPLEYLQNNDNEGFEFQEEITQQNRILEEASSGDGISSSYQVQKLESSKTLSLCPPQTLALPVSGSLVKSFIPITVRQEAQSEYHIAKSVPKLSYFGKENGKFSRVIKTTSQPQLINYARSKFSHEETSTNEDKPEPLPLKRSSTSPVELKDLLALRSVEAALNDLQFAGEQHDGSVNNKLSKNLAINPFIWKDNSADPNFDNLAKPKAREGNAEGPGAEANSDKLNSAVASETLENKEEEYDESAFQHENSIEIAKEEEEEDLENMQIEDFIEMSNEELRFITNCDKFGSPSSRTNEELRPHSEENNSSGVELLTTASPDFHYVELMQESPDLSPISRNSETSSFSRSRLPSQIEPSANSFIQSPASYNLQAKMEEDAGQARKEQGKSNKPLPGGSSSHHKSAKHIAKGFKKLLSFGRKSRGSETQSVRISSKNYEVDSSTKRARHTSNRLSDDLRKSRIEFSQRTSTSDGCFIKSGSYHEQDWMFSCIPGAPANFTLADYHRSRSSAKGHGSLFSLPSFRSKSESKRR